MSFGPRTPQRAGLPLSAMTRIDVLQDDRGLAACFRGANLEQSWIESYTKFHQISTLDDFVYMIQASDWEKSLAEHIDQVTSLKSNRIALARFKSSYEAGLQAPETRCPGSPEVRGLG